MQKDEVIKLILKTIDLEEHPLTWVEKDGRYKKRKAHFLNGVRINRDEYRAVKKLLLEYKQNCIQPIKFNWEQVIETLKD